MKKFIPLISLFAAILAFTAIRQIDAGIWNPMEAMADFMAGFFLVFGAFKLSKLSAFADAYVMYDIVAMRSRAYALAYPFIEIALGIAYLKRFELDTTNAITLVLMLVGSIGVAKKLAKHEVVPCACLGTVFKIPMTKVTLAEDLLMAAMAAAMLIG